MRLALADFWRELPLSFWLHLEGNPLLRLCIVAWRFERQAEVEFSQQIIERGIEPKVAALYGFVTNPLYIDRTTVNVTKPLQ